MARKRQTRIVADVEGGRRILLSIRELNDGRLIISLSKAKYSFWEDGFYRETITQKYTIHRSEKGAGGNTIHHTIEAKGVPVRETHIFTKCLKNNLVEPLYVQSMRDTHDQNATHIREKDRIEQITAYLPNWSILHFVVFLAPPEAEVDHIDPSKMYERKVVHFTNFSLLFALSFSLIPSSEKGWIDHAATASPKIGGGKS